MKGKVNAKLLGAVALLVVALVYLLVVRPQGAALAEARGERQAVETQVAQLERKGETKDATPVETDPRVVLLGAAIPATAELSNLFRQLNTIAAETGMQQTSLTPSALGAAEGAAGGSMQISLAATGPADAANAYLQRLATLGRLFVVEQFSLQRAAEGTGAVQLQLSGRVFTTEEPVAPEEG